MESGDASQRKRKHADTNIDEIDPLAAANKKPAHLIACKLGCGKQLPETTLPHKWQQHYDGQFCRANRSLASQRAAASRFFRKQPGEPQLAPRQQQEPEPRTSRPVEEVEDLVSEESNEGSVHSGADEEWEEWEVQRGSARGRQLAVLEQVAPQPRRGGSGR